MSAPTGISSLQTQWYIGKRWTQLSLQEPWLVVFAYSYGVNTPTLSDFIKYGNWEGGLLLCGLSPVHGLSICSVTGPIFQIDWASFSLPSAANILKFTCSFLPPKACFYPHSPRFCKLGTASVKAWEGEGILLWDWLLRRVATASIGVSEFPLCLALDFC